MFCYFTDASEAGKAVSTFESVKEFRIIFTDWRNVLTSKRQFNKVMKVFKQEEQLHKYRIRIKQ